MQGAFALPFGLFIAQPSYAENPNIQFELESGVEQVNGVEVGYNYDIDENEIIKSGNNAKGFFVNSELGVQLGHDNWISGIGFGNRPEVAVSFDWRKHYAEANEFLIPAVGNSPLDINGAVLGVNFIAGTFVADFEQQQFESGLKIKGDPGDGSEASIIPVAGFAYRNLRQFHNLSGKFTTQPTNPRSIIESNLKSNMYGLDLGTEFRTKSYGGFSFSMTPSAKVFYAQSRMLASQDNGGTVASVPTISRVDKKNHFVAEPALKIGVTYTYDFLSIGINAFGAYAINNPLIKLPEATGQTAGIDSVDIYKFGGSVQARVVF